METGSASGPVTSRKMVYKVIVSHDCVRFFVPKMNESLACLERVSN